jgi:hypothetical protein
MGIWGKKDLIGKPEEKMPLRTHSDRWYNNMKMVIGEVWWESVHWINLARIMDR